MTKIKVKKTEAEAEQQDKKDLKKDESLKKCKISSVVLHSSCVDDGCNLQEHMVGI